MGVATTRQPPRLRADAARNRAAIVSAAAAVIADRGPDADVRDIARCAGVGVGTLYRHFPTKDALLDTVIGEAFSAWAHAAREAAEEHADPWRALTAFCEDALSPHAGHCALLDRLAQSDDPGVTHAACHCELRPVIEALVARYHEFGVLRVGVDARDISLLLATITTITRSTSPTHHDWPRLLRIALDGLRPAHPSLPSRTD